MEMEIEVLFKNVADKDPKLLMDHIKNVADGGVSFFPTTLSLVYDRMIGKAFPKHHHSGSGPEKHPAGGRSSFLPSTSNPGSWAAGPPNVPTSNLKRWLKCVRCYEVVLSVKLYDGLYCPRCPSTGKNGMGARGRPFTVCSGCGLLRIERVDTCPKGSCGATFA